MTDSVSGRGRLTGRGKFLLRLGAHNTCMSTGGERGEREKERERDREGEGKGEGKGEREGKS